MRPQNKNLMIGVFILIALAIIVYILLFLHPNVGDEGQTLKVRFTNIDKISIGTRVLFAGHPVGEVTNIEEIEDARNLSSLHDNFVYIYQLTLKIDSGVIIYTTDLIAPTTSGLLGERAILISPRPAKKGEPLLRVTDQTLFAVPPTSVEDAIKYVGDLASKFNDGLAVLAKEKFWDHISETAQNISDITAALNQHDEIETFMSNINKGTIAKLFSSDDLYLRVTSLMNKGSTLMDDINHYGLLFNSNKEWQRLRARRMNLLSQLSSPQEFSNFFNDEVDQISTSIARVGMVISDGQNSCIWNNVCTKEFEEIFAELIRRVSALGDNIKLLNDQIVDEREPCQKIRNCQ